MGVQTLQNWRDDLGATSIGMLQRSGIGTALIDKWVNEAIREFGYALKFHELEAATSFPTDIGVTAYGVGVAITIDDFRFVDEMTVVDANSLITRVKPETRTRYRKNVGDATNPDTQALPKWYHKYGNAIYLRPVPDAIYSVLMDYYRKIVPLSAPTDTSPFQDDWDEVIEVGALYRGFRHFGEFDRYQNVRNDFLGLVRSRQTEYELEEFPEGGISPIGPKDTEDSEAFR